jgi:hypothetical protein
MDDIFSWVRATIRLREIVAGTIVSGIIAVISLLGDLPLGVILVLAILGFGGSLWLYLGWLKIQ